MDAPMERHERVMENEGTKNVLIVRHLPSSISIAEKQDFLKYFGAVHVRILSNFGRMKHTAFATFPDHSATSKALSRLHQLNVLGHTLVVEYAKNSIPSLVKSDASNYENSNVDNNDSARKDGNTVRNGSIATSTATHQKSSFTGRAQGHQQNIEMASKHGINFPLNPVLHYRYPAPTVGIFTNIINSLASVPRFYTQVLHLMNKMNLPAPFGPVTPAPPMMDNPIQAPSIDNNPVAMEMEVSSSSEDESEIESDPEEREKAKKAQASLKRVSNTKTPQQPKRPKLQPPLHHQVKTAMPVGVAPSTTQAVKPVDVFEQTQGPVGKKIEFRLTEGLTSTLDGGRVLLTRGAVYPNESISDLRSTTEQASSSQVSGFGTFEHPTTEKDLNVLTETPDKNEDQESDDDEDEEMKTTEFISRQQLKNRLPEHEIKRHPVFKRYDPGEPTTRLYIKNLAKTVEEKDLKYIYGRYVDWMSPLDRDMFTIQLMTQGRMKGQAFVGLPSEFAAQKALKDTNAFILQGKPIVVQFARSAKPKEQEEKASKKKGRKEI